MAILFLLVSSKFVPLLQKPPRSHTILRQSPVGSFQYWAWNLANQSSADQSVLLASPGGGGCNIVGWLGNCTLTSVMSQQNVPLGNEDDDWPGLLSLANSFGVAMEWRLSVGTMYS